MNTELSIIPDSKELVRQSTDIASLCKEIVVASAVNIQGKSYVRVEGWQAIATAHGCVASARDVRKVEGGTCATGEIRRMQDGQLIATAEGFVGEDEPTWYGGEIEKDEWKNNKKTGNKIKTLLPKRAEYAIRAMAQTRAISRACRGCFAHVVVLMNAGLSTTPAEEVPEGGFNDRHEQTKPEPTTESELTPDAEKAKRLAGRTKAVLAARPDDCPADAWLRGYAIKASEVCDFIGQKLTLEDMSILELKEIQPKHDEIVASLKKTHAA